MKKAKEEFEISEDLRGKFPSLSNTRIILILSCAIIVAEALIMAMFHFLNITNLLFELLLDSFLLILIISPVLHILVYKPMKNHILEKRIAEKEQAALLEQLIISNERIEENLFETNIIIEELSETKDSLEKTNAEKDKFFSIIAHDLKSPFSGFLGLTKIMAEELQDLTMAEMQNFSQSMMASANNLYKLLENLLEWSRMQRGVTEFNPEVCVLSKLIKQNVGIESEVAKLKDIELVSNIPENVSVFSDLPMLNTVIRNLMSNAIKFTPRGGRIELGTMNSSVGSQSADVCVYVKDNGLGMNPELLDKLFKIDKKSSRPGTEGEPSTGLGLLLCKEFVERQGGRIWVESEVGKGSTFYLTLPKEVQPLQG
jgi:signal transduction histidine kinase